MTREGAIDEIIIAQQSLHDAQGALNRLMDRHQGRWSVLELCEKDRKAAQERANILAVKLERCRDLAKDALTACGQYDGPSALLDIVEEMLREIIQCHD